MSAPEDPRRPTIDWIGSVADRNPPPLSIATLILATGTLLYFAHVARDVLIPFAIAVFLWAIALSFDRLLSRATAFRRLPGPARTAFLALVALSIFLFVAFVLATSVQNLVTAIPRIEERLQLLTVPFLDELGVDTSDLSINLLLRPEMRLSLFLSMMAYTRTFFTLAAQVVIFLVFFSIEGRYFARRIALAGDRAHGRERVGDWAERIRDLISRYLAVKVLSSLIVGAFAYFVLKLFRSEFALVVAAITFLLNFIPILGSIVAVLVGSALSVLTISSPGTLAVVVLLLSASQVLVGSLVENTLLGYRLNISPSVMLLTLSLFGLSWGVAGMILCVPILVTLLFTTAQFESTRRIAVLLSMTGDLRGLRI
jgi:predicted PurR-regulated permease PerM